MSTKLPTPRLVVLLEHPGDTELTEYEVQTDNRDWVAFDLTRARKQWPTTEESPTLWLNFMAHHAMCKRGNLQLTFEQFLERAVKCFPVDEDGEEIDPAAAVAGAVSAESFPPEAALNY